MDARVAAKLPLALDAATSCQLRAPAYAQTACIWLEAWMSIVVQQSFNPAGASPSQTFPSGGPMGLQGRALVPNPTPQIPCIYMLRPRS